MSRTLLALAAVALLAAPAFAGPVDDAVTALENAIGARVSDPGAPGGEVSKLNTALSGLASVDDEIGAPDLAGLLKAGKFLVKSKTQDASVLGAAGALAQTLVDYAQARADEIDAAVDQLFPSATTKKVAARTGAARSAITAAQALVESDPVGALTRMRAALAKLASIRRQVDAVAQQIAARNPLTKITSTLVGNTKGGTIVVTGVLVDLDVTPATSAPFALTGNITSAVPSASSYRLPYTLVNGGPFYNLASPIGYAITGRIGFESAHYSGVIRLLLKGGGTADFAISQ